MSEQWHLASGYRYAGIVSRLRSEPNRRDLAVIISERPAHAAGVFTQNRICAAPVQISRKRLPSSDVRAIVVCSGNANACTGEQGLRDAERMAELVAKELNCTADQVLVASTGVIGRMLPMPILEAGIPLVVQAVQGTIEAFRDAASAILTTDTGIKIATREFGAYRITGFAKGAAMIGPNMATMLGFIMTDAPLVDQQCAEILRRATQSTFNCISVEGHTSTNDTVFLLANGEGPRIETGSAQLHGLDQAIHSVCLELARAIAADAEGAKHLVTIHVEGSRSDEEARTIAKTVAESALVKTAIAGGDPNWGRIISAAGYSGISFDESHLSLWLGDLELYRSGQPLPFEPASASAYLKNHREISMTLRFSLGSGRCTFYTCDLTEDYVRLNADYTT